MKRHVTHLAVATCLALMSGTAWAKGPSAPYLAATSPQQLDMVQPGSAVKVLFVEEGARKAIQRIDLTR